MGDLDGRTFCITGANTGIGRDAALALARRGVRLILSNRSRDRSQPLLDEIAAIGTPPTFVRCDLADLDSVRVATATSTSTAPARSRAKR